MGEAKRRKQLDPLFGKTDNRIRFLDQMIKSLPQGLKQDLGHVIYSVAGEYIALIHINPLIPKVIGNIVSQRIDKSGRMVISSPVQIRDPIFGHFGLIAGKDVILSWGNNIGTFNFDGTMLARLALENRSILACRVNIKQRFLSGGQWVIPLDVLNCFNDNESESFREDQKATGKTTFNFVEY
jgi:hypothetical protein